MGTSHHKYAFSLEVAVAAADRWAKRGEQHAKFEDAVRNKQYSLLDTPERLAARANRLMVKLTNDAPRAAESIAAELELPAAGAALGGIRPAAVDDNFMERVIGKTRDFLFVEFLEEAVHVCKAVGRVATKLGGGRFSYGTGFMVSPRLLLTNHHVLTSADDASASVIEFDYQRDRTGRAATVRRFELDPGAFFLNDKKLDFALVAVSQNGSGKPLADYGFCPLIRATGKIVAGEPINIIQHPLGEMKQVVVRENRLIDALDGRDLFLHYEADTEPGSSGSPVFNDQWEVIALHHSGVPKRNEQGALLDVDGNVWQTGDDPARLDWVANEGIRVSKLCEFLAETPVKAEWKGLVHELLEVKPVALGEAEISLSRPVDYERRAQKRSAVGNARDTAGDDSVTLRVPLSITFRLGKAKACSDSGAAAEFPVETSADDAFDVQEKVQPDENYDNRPGYHADFLGFAAPFPTITNVIEDSAYAVPGADEDERFLLKYHHYSVIFNQDRRLAFVAGVNFDPMAKVQFQREGSDRWFFDPRVQPRDLQAGEDLYKKNPLDRGHLVRRADCAWGQTEAAAKLANDDTFHFTNCSPQHEITNQGKLREAPPGLKLWGKLEDHVARQGKSNKRKLSIFNGPVFRSSDTLYRGVQLPKEFWKLVVFESDAGEPNAVAFVLTQADLIEDLKEKFEVGEYKAVQVRVKDLEGKTHLDFGPFRTWDVMAQSRAKESFTLGVPAVVLESADDIVY